MIPARLGHASCIVSALVAAGLAVAAGSAVPAPTVTASPAPQTAAPGKTRAAARPDTTSCITCHREAEDDDLRKPAIAWASDVHAAAGLGCESCHGGDPAPARSKDPDEAGEAAMDPAKGFQSPPDRLHVPDFCARCHADAAFMKRYNPQGRVDQLAEYRTSVHGKLNAKGDPNPAVCIDCHGVHGIQPVSSPKSPTFAANVPKTCARCHADAAFMKPYKIPTNQYDEWGASVHAAALLEENDTAAPACNDCHGNHGAAPPEVKSVAHVCGNCHAREAALYHASIKEELFQELDVPECIVCHDHHRVRHPTPELFHSRSGPTVSAGRITSLDPFAADLGDLAVGQGANASWRVVLAPHVKPGDTRLAHRVEIVASSTDTLLLDATVRPGEAVPPAIRRARGSTGLSASLSIEPLRGTPVEAGDALLYRLEVTAAPAAAARAVRVRDLPGKAVAPFAGSACLQCHELGDSCDVASERMYATLLTLDREIRLASATLRRAELAGMEVSAPRFELKSKGTTAAVEARALVHSFDPERLLKRAAEGRAAAASAMGAGRGALRELEMRRRGLAVSLVLILLVLVGLYLKIREVDRARRTGPTGGGTG